MQAIDVITDALMEIGALAQGETASGDDALFALSRLNDMLDLWAAQSIFVYAKAFVGSGGDGDKAPTYTLTPNHQPHTIGPSTSSPDFVIPSLLSQRPVKIGNAAIVLTNSIPYVYNPLMIRDSDWWANNRVRGVTTELPTDLYYEPDMPNGSLYLWPVPTVAYRLDLELWSTLGQIPTLTQTLVLPPGYASAVKYSLAEALAAPFRMPLLPGTTVNAMKARQALQGNNTGAPRITTKDFGVPSAGSYSGTRADFNWLSGGVQ